MEPLRIAYRIQPRDMLLPFMAILDTVRAGGALLEVHVPEEGFFWHIRDSVRRGPPYDIVVVNVSIPDQETLEIGHDLHDILKGENVKPLLVAESAYHPAFAEIPRQHFDRYARPLYEGRNLERLLAVQPKITMKAFAHLFPTS